MLIGCQRTLQETRSSCKIWSLYKFGSIDINWDIRNLRNLMNPFQYTFRNRKPLNFSKFNSVVPFYAVRAHFNRLFRHNNRLFFKETWERFWKRFVLAVWIKPKPSLAKNIVLRSKNSFNKTWWLFTATALRCQK